MRRQGVLGIALLAASCGGQDDRITIEFPNQAALEAVEVLSVTAFEPFVRDPDSDEVEFVGCEDVGVFPPSSPVDPGALHLSNLLGSVLAERESQDFPFEGFDVSFPPPDATDPRNPWGAVLVFIEGRGDARASGEGFGQVASTLVRGCYCVRTAEGGSAGDRALDQAVRNACPLLGVADGTGEERVVALEPVVPPEFELSTCAGSLQTLTAPRGGTLEPGPAICLGAVRCDDIAVPRDCFRCEQQRCSELNDQRNAPIRFTLSDPASGRPPETQVVLTSPDGRATADFTVGDCTGDVIVTAELLGRNEPPIRFEVECVEPVGAFSCTAESTLAPGYEPVAASRVPSEGGCSAATPERCEQVALLYERGEGALLEIRSPALPSPVLHAFPGRRAHTVHGFYYDPAARARPSVAVVTSDAANVTELYVFEWRDGQLLPHDGADGAVGGPCGWLPACESRATCSPSSGCTRRGESCVGGSCRLDPCAPTVTNQSELAVAARDLDGDDLADLAVADVGGLPVSFFWSGAAGPGEMYADGECACGRFNQNPKAFDLVEIGGPPWSREHPDLVLGASGGTAIVYGSAANPEAPLSCGQAAPIQDGLNVLDIQVASYQCDPATTSCFQDAVIVSSQGVSGGSLDEPGFIRVLYGSDRDLSSELDVLEIPGVSLGLTPIRYPDRNEPRDPRRAQDADFNGDGHQDLAVLYKASEEIHVWLGASNRGLGEIELGALVDDCAVSLSPGTRCAPLPDFVTPDLDGDGRAEIAVICDPMGQPRIRYYASSGVP